MLRGCGCFFVLSFPGFDGRCKRGEKERERGKEEQMGYCLRKEGRVVGVLQYCVLNKGVLKGERIVAVSLCSLSVAFFLPHCRYSFIRISSFPRGKRWDFCESACLVDRAVLL